MTRRRRTASTATDEIELAHLPPPPEPAPVTMPSLTDERRTQELEEIIDEIGNESRVRIWQITDGKPSFAGEMGGEGFTLDALLDAYGGGDKALAIYQGRVCVSRVRVSLDPTIPPKNPRQPKAVAGAAPAPGATPVADVAALMSAMATSQINAAAQMNTMMTGIIGALTTVMTATRPAKDPTEVALEIAKVMRGNGDQPTGFMEAMKWGLDIGERIGGGKDGDDDGVMTAVNKGLDTLGDVVKAIVEERKQRALPAAQPVQVVEVPVPVAAPTDAPTPTNEAAPPVATGDGVTGTIRPWVAAARPYIGQLFAASKFMRPDAAAATISNNLNDEQFDDLLDDIHDESNGGFGARLQMYFPNEVKHADPNWVGEVLQLLLSDVDEDEEPPTSTEPPTPGA